ncbi:MAG TPA: hypothetical protein VHC19_00635 [Pirellulales bacterium]|jgi:hypothetical protein|nr:hypothetical protein [Pirellulales bacterium]
MSKLGFYGWIRENVRRAVLLGFSDAVEQLGSPIEGDEMHPQLVAVLKQPKPLLTTEEPAPRSKSTSTSQGGRKRLGQTLDQIQERASTKTGSAGA